jgi:hypothetical protein
MNMNAELDPQDEMSELAYVPAWEQGEGSEDSYLDSYWEDQCEMGMMD